jgi:hypothetical protein
VAADGTGAVAGAGVGAAFAAGAAAGVAAEPVAGLAAEDFAAGAAYQVCTPLCPLQAPDLLGAVEYVPSLQSPVAPAGAPAGACATQTCEARIPNESAIKWIILFIFPSDGHGKPPCRLGQNLAFDREACPGNFGNLHEVTFLES